MDDEDGIVAHLAIMCPDHDVRLISGIVHQIQTTNPGNNELLFNLCLDRVLFGKNEIPTDLAPKNDNQVLNNLTDDSPVAGSSTGQTGHVENREPNRLSEINPTKIVDTFELDRYANHVKDIFPNIEKRWISDQFSKGSCLTMIVEQIVNHPGDVPKEKKPDKKSTGVVTKTKTDYFKDYFDERPDGIYMKSATNLLLDEFRLLSNKSLIAVMTYFNYRYAPTLKCLKNNLIGVNFRTHRGQMFPINLTGHADEGETSINIQMNNSQRPRKNHIFVPGNLQHEVDWIKEHLSEIDQSNNATSATISSSTAMNAVDLERQQKLTEARDRGDVYECAVCCDEMLIYEMVPCTDGHLFCNECLRNHAREIVFGQAKAIITCLEVECKAGFTRDTLQKALDADWMEKLEERQLEEDVNCADIEGLIKCKYCNYAVVMDAPVEQNKVFKCGNSECERAVCRLCGTDWEEHVGLRCEELENSDETKFRRETEEKMAEAVIRRCYKCKVQLVKTEGCNHMTCRCGAQMCYICRVPWQGHHCKDFQVNDKIYDAAKLEEIKKTIDAEQETVGAGRKRKIGVDDTKFTAPPPVRPPAGLQMIYAGAANFMGFTVPPQIQPAVRLPPPAQGPTFN